MDTWLGLGGLHILCIFLEHLPEPCHVQADVAQQVEDVQCNGPQTSERCIQMLQLHSGTISCKHINLLIIL